MGNTAYKIIKIGGVLIAVFLIGGKATQWGQLLSSAGTAGGGIIRRLQGR